MRVTVYTEVPRCPPISITRRLVRRRLHDAVLWQNWKGATSCAALSTRVCIRAVLEGSRPPFPPGVGQGGVPSANSNLALQGGRDAAGGLVDTGPSFNPTQPNP